MDNTLSRLWSISIGVDRYADPRIPTLNYAVADAGAFHAAVTGAMRPGRDEASLLTDEQATLRALRTEIGDRVARGARPEDIVLIYFSGHGSPEASSEVDRVSRYLVLHDTAYDSIFATGLDLERDLVRMLERIRARHIVVFLDACFSGAAGGRTFEGPELQKQRRGTRLAGIDLDKLELGEGRMMLTACDDWQVARESPELSHGIFTYFLLKTLAQDTSDEPTISVPRLYDDVASSVARWTSGRQLPILSGRGRLLRLPYLRRAVGSDPL